MDQPSSPRPTSLQCQISDAPSGHYKKCVLLKIHIFNIQLFSDTGQQTDKDSDLTDDPCHGSDCDSAGVGNLIARLCFQLLLGDKQLRLRSRDIEELRFNHNNSVDLCVNFYLSKTNLLETTSSILLLQLYRRKLILQNKEQINKILGFKFVGMAVFNLDHAALLSDSSVIHQNQKYVEIVHQDLAKIQMRAQKAKMKANNAQPGGISSSESGDLLTPLVSSRVDESMRKHLSQNSGPKHRRHSHGGGLGSNQLALELSDAVLNRTSIPKQTLTGQLKWNVSSCTVDVWSDSGSETSARVQSPLSPTRLSQILSNFSGTGDVAAKVSSDRVRQGSGMKLRGSFTQPSQCTPTRSHPYDSHSAQTSNRAYADSLPKPLANTNAALSVATASPPPPPHNPKLCSKLENNAALRPDTAACASSSNQRSTAVETGDGEREAGREVTSHNHGVVGSGRIEPLRVCPAKVDTGNCTCPYSEARVSSGRGVVPSVTDGIEQDLVGYQNVCQHDTGVRWKSGADTADEQVAKGPRCRHHSQTRPTNAAPENDNNGSQGLASSTQLSTGNAHIMNACVKRTAETLGPVSKMPLVVERGCSEFIGEPIKMALDCELYDEPDLLSPVIISDDGGKRPGRYARRLFSGRKRQSHSTGSYVISDIPTSSCSNTYQSSSQTTLNCNMIQPGQGSSSCLAHSTPRVPGQIANVTGQEDDYFSVDSRAMTPTDRHSALSSENVLDATAPLWGRVVLSKRAPSRSPKLPDARRLKPDSTMDQGSSSRLRKNRSLESSYPYTGAVALYTTDEAPSAAATQIHSNPASSSLPPGQAQRNHHNHQSRQQRRQRQRCSSISTTTPANHQVYDIYDDLVENNQLSKLVKALQINRRNLGRAVSIQMKKNKENIKRSDFKGPKILRDRVINAMSRLKNSNFAIIKEDREQTFEDDNLVCEGEPGGGGGPALTVTGCDTIPTEALTPSSSKSKSRKKFIRIPKNKNKKHLSSSLTSPTKTSPFHKFHSKKPRSESRSSHDNDNISVRTCSSVANLDRLYDELDRLDDFEINMADNESRGSSRFSFSSIRSGASGTIPVSPGGQRRRNRTSPRIKSKELQDAIDLKSLKISRPTREADKGQKDQDLDSSSSSASGSTSASSKNHSGKELRKHEITGALEPLAQIRTPPFRAPGVEMRGRGGTGTSFTPTCPSDIVDNKSVSSLLSRNSLVIPDSSRNNLLTHAAIQNVDSFIFTPFFDSKTSAKMKAAQASEQTGSSSH